MVLDGHTVEAYTDQGHPNYIVDGINVRGSQELPLFSSYDLIVTQLMGDYTYRIFRYGLPVIYLAHSENEFLRRITKKAHIVANTERVQGFYGRGTVLHPPVEPSRYHTHTTREYVTLINLSIGKPVGSYDKGARTFYELARRFPDERFLAVRGGYGEQFVPSDLPSNVTVMDHTPNVREVYGRTKLIVMPSTYESYGRAAAEAACSGIPSVMTDLPGTREAMGEASLYSDAHDLDQWELQVTTILNDYDSWSMEAEQRSVSNWLRTQNEFQFFLNAIA